jgi:hypothetical protein
MGDFNAIDPLGLFGVGDVGPVDLGGTWNQASSLLGQEIALAPQAYNAQATYGPKYNQLTLDQILKSAGGEGGLGQAFGSALPWLQSGIAGANRAQREANVGDIAGGGQAATNAIRGMNPQLQAIFGGLEDQAISGLKAGTQLGPQDTSRITNQVRGDWANRGLGASAPAQLDEALNLYAGGQSALQQREGFASNTAGLENQYLNLPALGLLTGESQAPGMAQGVLGQANQIAGPSGPSLTHPSDILDAAYNSTAAAQIQSGNNRAGIAGGLLSY